jgi:hypothetical protein
MTANVLILSAAGMLVSAYLMVGQKALFTTPGYRGRDDGDLRIAS